jgi:hypothetical protein
MPERLSTEAPWRPSATGWDRRAAGRQIFNAKLFHCPEVVRDGLQVVTVWRRIRSATISGKGEFQMMSILSLFQTGPLIIRMDFNVDMRRQ